MRKESLLTAAAQSHPALFACLAGQGAAGAYLKAQLLAQEVDAALPPFSHYPEASQQPRAGVDFRQASMRLAAHPTATIRQLTFIGTSQGQTWIGENSVVENVLVNSERADFTLVIAPNCEIRNCVIQAMPGKTWLVLGAGTTINKANFYLQETERYIAIGSDCLFSNDIAMRTSDSHGIYDAVSGLPINPGRPVRIGRHVWLGRYVSLNKGTTIKPNTVVGQYAVTCGLLEEGSIYAGNPARKVRSGVIWERVIAESYEQASMPVPHRVRDGRLRAYLKELQELRPQLQESSLAEALSLLLAHPYDATVLEAQCCHFDDTERQFMAEMLALKAIAADS